MAAALTLHFARYSSSRDMRLEPGFLLVIDFKRLKVRGSRLRVLCICAWSIESISCFFVVTCSSISLKRKAVSPTKVALIVIIWKLAAEPFVHSFSTSPRWSSPSPVHRLLSLSLLKKNVSVELSCFDQSFAPPFSGVIYLHDWESPLLKHIVISYSSVYKSITCRHTWMVETLPGEWVFELIVCDRKHVETKATSR